MWYETVVYVLKFSLYACRDLGKPWRFLDIWVMFRLWTRYFLNFMTH